MGNYPLYIPSLKFEVVIAYQMPEAFAKQKNLIKYTEYYLVCLKYEHLARRRCKGGREGSVSIPSARLGAGIAAVGACHNKINRSTTKGKTKIYR